MNSFYKKLFKKFLIILSAVCLATVVPTAHAAPISNGYLAVLYKESGSPTVIRLYEADGSGIVRDIVIADSASDKVSGLSWSPDGSELAFVKNGDVSIVDVNSAEERQIITDVYDPSAIMPNDRWSISWSPDGKMLAFTVQGKMYYVTADGTKLIGTLDPFIHGTIDWSNDDRLAISYLNGQLNPNFPESRAYISAVRANSTYRVTSTDYSGMRDVALSDTNDSAAFVAWTSTSSSRLYTTTNGGAAQEVPNQDGNAPATPSFSPDGQFLAYVTNGGMHPFTSRLAIQSTQNTSAPTVIAAPTGAGFLNPVWQPVGATVAPAEYNDFYRLRNKTNNIRMLTDNSDEKDYKIGGLGNWELESRPFKSYPWQDPETVPIYRFSQLATGNQLLTTNEVEARNVTNNIGYWQYEGIAGFARETPASDSMPVYRMTNLASNQKLYTSDPNEVAYAQKGDKKWWYEGIAFYVPKNTSYSDKNVYRMTNYITGERIFTTNAEEVFYAQQRYPGWQYEGIAFKAAASSDPNTSPIYRLTNYYRQERLFTSSAFEASYAVQHYPGWVNEGEVFKAYATQQPSTVPVYRLVNWAKGGRLFTTSQIEVQIAVAKYPGWVSEGIAFYATP